VVKEWDIDDFINDPKTYSTKEGCVKAAYYMLRNYQKTRSFKFNP